MSDKKLNIHMPLKTETTEQLDAVPVIAAETVVTRHLKVVDEFGHVRIDATVDVSEEGGPRLRLFDRGGSALADLVIIDGDEPYGCTYLWLGSAHDDSEACLTAGGLKGPSVNLASGRGSVSGTRLELLAEDAAAFVVAHGRGEARTLMQLTPGEQPATFVDQDDDESEATS